MGSIAVLSWLYGFITLHKEWFPTELLEHAWEQWQNIDPRRGPMYLHNAFYDREGARSPLPEQIQPGLTFIASAWESSNVLMPGLRLIDADGTVLHEWRVDAGKIFAESRKFSRAKDLDIHGSYLFPNGDVLVNLEYTGTVRLDACGNVLWRLQEGNHHSISRNEDGTFWMPAVTPRRRESPEHPNGFPGIHGRVYQDKLMHVSEDGTILDTINVLDVLYANDLEWHLAEEGQLDDADPIHLNDIEALPDSLADQYPLFRAGDLLISLRHIDMVLVVDPTSRRVKWYNADSQIFQHDPDFIGDGWIAIFDNRQDDTERGTMLGGSRIIALQPDTDSLRILFPTSLSDPFYTTHRGKFQLLDNGNLLLVEEAAGRVLEAAPDGRTVWEWIVEPVEQSGRRKVPGVTSAKRVSFSRSDVAKWRCAPGISTNTKGGL